MSSYSKYLYYVFLNKVIVTEYYLSKGADSMADWFSVVNILIGAAVGAIVSWLFFQKQKNWENMKEHFDDLKNKVIDPLLKSLDDPSIFDQVDKELYSDMRSHYPELVSSYENFKAIARNAGEIEREMHETAEKLVVDALNRKGRRHQGDFDKKTGVVFTKRLSAELSSNMGKDLLIDIKSDLSKPVTVSRYFLRVGESAVYYTTSLSEAEEMQKDLQEIIGLTLGDSALKEKKKRLDDLKTNAETSKRSCEHDLQAVRAKTRLRMKKKYHFFSESCKYLKT